VEIAPSNTARLKRKERQMISQVEVANPGFSEALISLAGLGKAIDQSLRQVVAVPAAARLAPAPQTSSGSGHAGSGEPTAFAMPTISGLDSVQALAQAIADALNATLVQSLNGIASAISDCCAEIGTAVSEMVRATGVLDAISKTLAACKCQDIGEALKRELEPIRRALREHMDFGLEEQLQWAATMAGIALGLAALAGASLLVGIGAAIAAALATVGLLRLFDEPSPQDDQEQLDRLREEERARRSEERPIEEAPQHLRDHIQGLRQQDLERRIEEYEDVIGRLRKRIEDPEADGDMVKELDREDALRALPGARDDYFDLLRQYKGDYWRHPRFNQDLRRWLEDFEPQGKYSEPETERPRHEQLQPERNTPLPETEDPRHNPNHPRWEPLPPIAAGEPNLNELAALSPGAGPEGGDPTLRGLLEAVLYRLSQPLRIDPVRLEVRLLDDRVIARRLDGNRSVDVDLSRGYRMVGYLSV
jgi:hypothetical protein